MYLAMLLLLMMDYYLNVAQLRVRKLCFFRRGRLVTVVCRRLLSFMT